MLLTFFLCLLLFFASEPTTISPVDPIYYCTYGHDHGSYPGKYKPAFTHTAHKTTEEVKDEQGNVISTRQVESDEGFKIFTMFEENKDNKKSEWLHWIFVIHMELSNGRRFSARHHTVHVTTFDHSFKKVMLKVALKNDFGMAAVKTDKGIEPLNSAMETIRKQRRNARLAPAFRQFNLRSGTGECAMRGKTIKTSPVGKRGKAEHWKAPLNTCSSRGATFKVDVQRPRTGLMTCATVGKQLKLDYLAPRSK